METEGEAGIHNQMVYTLVAAKARAYDNGTKRCDLCLTEKLFIINAVKGRLLNGQMMEDQNWYQSAASHATITSATSQNSPRILR